MCSTSRRWILPTSPRGRRSSKQRNPYHLICLLAAPPPDILNRLETSRKRDIECSIAIDVKRKHLMIDDAMPHDVVIIDIVRYSRRHPAVQQRLIVGGLIPLIQSAVTAV